MKCMLISGCENEAFKELNRCALHCSDEEIRSNDIDDYLKYFSNLFMQYLFEKIVSNKFYKVAKDRKVTPDYEIKDFKYNELMDNESLVKKIGTIDILIEDINFARKYNKRSLSLDCINITKKLGKITFKNCHFNDFYFIGSYNSYYEYCVFDEDTSIYPPPHVTDKEGEKSIDYRFIECVFNKDVSVESYGLLKENSSNIFRNCNFEENISIRNSKINGILFNFYNFYSLSYDLQKNMYNPKIFLDKIRNMYNFEGITIINSVLECKFELNGFNKVEVDKYRKIDSLSEYDFDSLENLLNIKYLEVGDSKFKSKLEVKNAKVDSLIFENSNVYGIFDINESRVIKASFYKSIFEEFAVFENVVFGDEKKENRTKFIYTTFKDFSNFRNTNFSSGLDFSSVNLKQEPNFLNAKINEEDTDRETFRIIKNSFDDVGNKLEANRFFVQEMKAFKNELKEEGSFWDKLVYNMNDIISEFGRNYIRPIIWLIVSLILYTILLSLHHWYFVHFDYFIWGKLEWIWMFLNDIAKNFLPFSRFLETKNGFEFISLFFYIWFGILIWQIVVSVKRHTQR